MDKFIFNSKKTEWNDFIINAKKLLTLRQNSTEDSDEKEIKMKEKENIINENNNKNENNIDDNIKDNAVRLYSDNKDNESFLFGNDSISYGHGFSNNSQDFNF